jgi:cytochrome P450
MEQTYEPKRKALGSAFSRSKLKDITKCVKEITIKEI